MDDVSDAVLLCASNTQGYLVTRSPTAPYAGGRAKVAVPAAQNNWRPATTYAANAQVNSQQGVYLTQIGGTSASSGPGPSGTGQAISDNTVVWQFVGYAKTTFTAYGSLQPLKGAELARLPEEYRTKEVRAFWTTSVLRTSGPDGEADVVSANGFNWQVDNTEQWEDLGNYRKVLLVRVGR